MENRQTIEFQLEEKVFFEATISNGRSIQTLVRDRKDLLMNAVNVWLADDDYKLKKVEEVTRKIAKF